jgi:hypothetical protein
LFSIHFIYAWSEPTKERFYLPNVTADVPNIRFKLCDPRLHTGIMWATTSP